MGSQEHIEMICHKTTGNKSLKKFFLEELPHGNLLEWNMPEMKKKNRHVETPDEIPYKPIFPIPGDRQSPKHNKTLAKSSHSIPFLVIFFY